MKVKFLGAILLAFIVVYGLLQCAVAQGLPKGLLIYWAENPASEEIGWYRVDVRDGQTQTWVLVGSTSFCQARDQFIATYRVGDATLPASVCSLARELSALPLTSPIVEGTQLCFRLIAAKTGERSDPTDTVCGTVAVLTPPIVPPVDDGALSTPQSLTVLFQ